jgi:hypothetical protein
MAANPGCIMVGVVRFLEEAMKTKTVVGKRITGIIQNHAYNSRIGCMVNFIESIILEDGTELRPVVDEWDDRYSVNFVVVKRRH